MKREALVVILLSLILIVPIISAGFFSDIWNKVTGEVTSDTLSVNITLGNNPPNITWVEQLISQNVSEGGMRSITFNFTATDTDGYANIDVSTAEARFIRSGETTRSNTSCINYSQTGDDVNFTCTLGMWYFDEAGNWTINVTVQDINSGYTENTSINLTYNSFPGMVLSPDALTWGSLQLTDTNTGSDNDPVTINNTGNVEGYQINVTGLDLQGEETDTQFIYANNFSVENITQGCTGTELDNNTAVNITSAILSRGNTSLNYENDTSGQEQIFFCLRGLPSGLTSQSYSSAGYGSWNVEVISP